jgi:hypothetical protein
MLTRIVERSAEPVKYVPQLQEDGARSTRECDRTKEYISTVHILDIILKTLRYDGIDLRMSGAVFTPRQEIRHTLSGGTFVLAAAKPSI